MSQHIWKRLYKFCWALVIVAALAMIDEAPLAGVIGLGVSTLVLIAVGLVGERLSSAQILNNINQGPLVPTGDQIWSDRHTGLHPAKK